MFVQVCKQLLSFELLYFFNTCIDYKHDKRQDIQVLLIACLSWLWSCFWQTSTLRSAIWLSVIWRPYGCYFGALSVMRYRFGTPPTEGCWQTWLLRKKTPLGKKGAICSNSTPGALFWYPFFLSVCLDWNWTMGARGVMPPASVGSCPCW